MAKKPVKYSGVEVRDASIRLRFTLDGKTIAKRLNDADGNALIASDANVRHAARLVEQIKMDIKMGVYAPEKYFADEVEKVEPEPLPTFAEQLDVWLLTSGGTPSTLKGYASCVNFWKRAPCKKQDDGVLSGRMGDMRINEIKPTNLKIAANAFKNLSGKTINNYLRAYKGAMDLAVEEQLISTNPDASKARQKWQKVPPDPFDIKEVALIVRDMRMTYDSRVADLVEFWFHTGLRTSELYGLRWPSIDFRKKEMLVHETVVRGEYKNTTKTNQSRIVHLSDRAMELLLAQKSYTFMKGEYVFENPAFHEPWGDERAFRRSYWTPTLKRTGIRYRRPYQLRHSNASMRLMAGQVLGYAASQMGHDVKIFAEVYARWISGERDVQERSKMQDFLEAADKLHTLVSRRFG